MLEFAIAAAPLLALLCALLLGRYPGCEAIVRLADRLSPAPAGRPDAPRRARRPLPPASFAASGGLLIAFGLARRPPPLAP
jgi:hypothetical protein